MEASVVTPPSVPAAGSARAVKDHPPPPPPPSGARRPAGRRWHHREGAPGTPKSRRTQARGRRLKRERVRATPSAQSPARTRRPKLPPSGATRQRTPCQHLPDGRKRPTRAKTTATGATGNSSLTTAAFPEESHGRRTAKSSPSPRSRAPRDNWSTLVDEGVNKRRGPPSPTSRIGGRPGNTLRRPTTEGRRAQPSGQAPGSGPERGNAARPGQHTPPAGPAQPRGQNPRETEGEEAGEKEDRSPGGRPRPGKAKPAPPKEPAQTATRGARGPGRAGREDKRHTH